jgi:hypothetical protein
MVASAIDDIRLLEKAAALLFEWDATWDQWPPKDAIRAWLRDLEGVSAAVVADALRTEPGAAQHFEEISRDNRVDARIREAIRRAA